jgi:phosphoglycerate dehydrogenase-like enzyme
LRDIENALIGIKGIKKHWQMVNVPLSLFLLHEQNSRDLQLHLLVTSPLDRDRPVRYCSSSKAKLCDKKGFNMRLAILDDYQGLATSIVDWSQVKKLTVVSFRDHVFNEEELINRLSHFDVIMRIRERSEFSRHVLENLPRLKLLLATGMRNSRSIDLAAADELNVIVCAIDALHQTTVEVTWMLLLSLFRGFGKEVGSVQNGSWQRGLGRGLGGKTLGVLGLGNMGKPVATIAQNFGMQVIAWSPNLTPERTMDYGIECVAKEEIFRRSDAVTIHLPHVKETENLVGATEIRLMKSNAFLINTSRPKIIDEVSLIRALEKKTIGGAGLDVFNIEPLPEAHPLRTLSNVIATPHIGFVTEENYKIFYQESLENLKAFIKGSPIRVINAKNPFLINSQVARQMHKPA